MQKLWVVLKVSLTRPWVWTMLPMVLFQMIPIWKFAPKNPITEYKNAIPAFDQFDVVATNMIELNAFAQRHELGKIEGLECRDMLGDITFDEQGKPLSTRPAIINPGFVHSTSSWPILEKTPELKSLTFSPPNSIDSEGWKRIRNLRNLEVLNLESVSISAADKAQFQYEMNSTLMSLPNLRQLNLNNFGGLSDWKLPPLSRVEHLVLGFNLQMESNLETLEKSSPYLQTLVLHTFDNFDYTDRMIESLRRIKSLRRLIIASSSKSDAWHETQRQVEYLRERLPRLDIERGVFSHNRVILHLFLSFIAGFLPFIAWFQSGLKLSQPLAAVMPGHRGPHLFWPVASSITSAIVFVFFSMRAGTFWPAAVSLAAMESMLVAAILPGHDLTARWRSVIQYISMMDVIGLFSCIGLALGGPYYADAYLMGDYPGIATFLMLWFLAAGVWKVWRAARLHRILAESGMTGIPGMNVGMQQIMDQPFKPAPGWSMANWQLQRLQNAMDRKIAKMDRSNWIDMLRKASPSNLGLWGGLFVMAIFFVLFRQFAPPQQRQALTRGPMLAVGVWQATMTLLMINIMMWVSRRGTVIHEFLRPISRPLFWRNLRLAILHDLKWAALFGLTGGLFSTYLGNKNSLPPLTVFNAVLGAVGAVAWLHGWVTLAVIGKRLWLHATLGLLTSGLAFVGVVASIVLTTNEQPDPVTATGLAVGLVSLGAALQWAIAKRLPDWELA